MLSCTRGRLSWTARWIRQGLPMRSCVISNLSHYITLTYHLTQNSMRTSSRVKQWIWLSILLSLPAPFLQEYQESWQSDSRESSLTRSWTRGLCRRPTPPTCSLCRPSPAASAPRILQRTANDHSPITYRLRKDTSRVCNDYSPITSTASREPAEYATTTHRSYIDYIEINGRVCSDD